MASMMDAVIFTVIIGLLVVNFVIPAAEEAEMEGQGGGVHDRLLLLRFNASPFHPELGNVSLSLAELAMLQMRDGPDEVFQRLVEDCVRTLLETGTEWSLAFIHEGDSLLIGEPGLEQSDNARMTSRNVSIPNGGIMVTQLCLS
jgi:hypothetical protein